MSMMLRKRERIAEHLRRMRVDPDAIFLFAERNQAAVILDTSIMSIIIDAEDWQLRAYPNGKPRRDGSRKWLVYGTGPVKQLKKVLGK